MVFVKTHDIAELTSELIGKEVVLGGWIEDLRKLGKMSFITLRDVSGISQVIVKGELNDNLGEINRQSVVSVKGIVQETKARDFAFEIKAEEIEVLGKAIHPLPGAAPGKSASCRTGAFVSCLRPDRRLKFLSRRPDLSLDAHQGFRS